MRVRIDQISDYNSQTNILNRFIEGLDIRPSINNPLQLDIFSGLQCTLNNDKSKILNLTQDVYLDFAIEGNDGVFVKLVNELASGVSGNNYITISNNSNFFEIGDVIQLNISSIWKIYKIINITGNNFYIDEILTNTFSNVVCKFGGLRKNTWYAIWTMINPEFEASNYDKIIFTAQTRWKNGNSIYSHVQNIEGYTQYRRLCSIFILEDEFDNNIIKIKPFRMGMFGNIQEVCWDCRYTLKEINTLSVNSNNVIFQAGLENNYSTYSSNNFFRAKRNLIPPVSCRIFLQTFFYDFTNNIFLYVHNENIENGSSNDQRNVQNVFYNKDKSSFGSNFLFHYNNTNITSTNFHNKSIYLRTSSGSGEASLSIISYIEQI